MSDMLDAIKRLPPIPATTGVEPVRPKTPAGTGRAANGQSFSQELEKTLSQSQPLTFSGHAQSRLLTRQIQLTDQQRSRLEYGVQQAAQKGSKESLVVMDNLAFIVSVPNRTVVTAVDGANRNGNVFTQIDSAVIV
jgi:flagellar operon protein